MEQNSFTFSYFIDFLQLSLKNNYNFIFFNEIDMNLNNKFILLRHDIDFDIEKALEIALIEKEQGIKATYFFLLTSNFYNLYNIKSINIVNKIKDLGHKISIHFDQESYFLSENINFNKSDLNSFILKEIHFFQEIYNTKVDIISFHRPNENVLRQNFLLSISNTYEKKYVDGIKYISDSKKDLKNNNLLDIIRRNLFKHIHLLLHPIWWNHTYTSSQEDYNNFIENQINRLKQDIANNSAVYKYE